MKAGTGVFVAALGGALCNSSYALDFGPPQQANEAFNALAKIMKAAPRMVLSKCEGSPPAACMFGLSGKITVLAVADAKSPDKAQLIVLGADRSSDPKQFVQSAQIAMAAFSKTEDLQEIKSAFDVLFAKPIKQFREVQVRGVKYSLKNIDGGGIFFTISDASMP